MTNKRVLVVDDDQQMQSLLKQILRLEGYEVEHAHDGLQALEQLARNSGYVMVILDLHMPQMDGLQFLQTLQQQKQVSLPPIIAYSGDGEAMKQAVLVGASFVLAKPFDLEHLLTVIRSATIM